MYTVGSSVICLVVSLWLMITHNELNHWFVVPATLCGIIAGRDILRWVFGTVGSFDSSVLASFVIFNGFYIAPMMQIVWNFFPYISPLDDWRHWFGILSWINFVGLILMVVSRDYIFPKAPKAKFEIWRIDKQKFLNLSIILLTVSALCLVYIFAKFGGYSGVASAYAVRAQLGVTNYNPFEGLGALFVFAISFSVLLPTTILVLVSDKPFSKSWVFFGLYCAFSVALAISIAGAFGSRSRMIYPIFICLATYNYLIKPIGKNVIIGGVIGGIVFMNTYYWYKVGGVEGLRAIFDASYQEQILARKKVADEGKFSMVRDFSRADIQAVIVERNLTDRLNIAYGRTYLGAIFAIVPRGIMPSRPETAAMEKTEALYGEGSYKSSRVTTMIAGLTGEAILNFGVILAPLAYLAIGLIAGFVRYLQRNLDKSDSRMFIVPSLTLLPTLLIFNDSNIVVMFAFMYMFAPLVLVLFARADSFNRRAA